MRTAHLAFLLPFALGFAASAVGADGSPDCPPADPILAGSPFVVVATPAAGARVEPGFEVAGCSRTHEGSIAWRLVGQQGNLLASGRAAGGGAGGAAPFSFRPAFELAAAERAHLEVGETPVTGEGYPPPSTRIALVVAPGAPSLPLFGRFEGMLPCADCAGIATDLALYGDFGSVRREYVLVATYRGTKESDRRYVSRGRWEVMLGAPGEPDARLVVLDPGDPERERSYAIAGADLVQRDLDRRAIDSKLDYTLRRRGQP